MSHANGAVRFLSDGRILYFEYNGTTDVCISRLYGTYREMRDNWRKGEWLDCTCGGEEPVEILADFGKGFYWNGRACRNCMALTENLSTDYGDGIVEQSGHPEWSPF